MHGAFYNAQPPLYVANLLLLVKAVHIANNVLGCRVEDFALPECDGGEDEENYPGRTYYDRHDQIPDVETLNVEGIPDFADGENPAN